MRDNVYKVPQSAWYGDIELELKFPNSWQVECCTMPGIHRVPLSAKDLEEALYAPIGTEPINELAKGKKEIAILFDDMSRPTKVAKIIPYVLDQLDAAGVKDRQVRFIAALGSHGALTREDFAKKLGEDVLDRFPVYNHNPFDNCVRIGKTERGTPVEVNLEVMNCDLKIGIGCIVPHYTSGFGGGAKIVLPGIASIESMWTNHHKIGGRDKPSKGEILGRLNPSVGVGKVEGNDLRLDMEEAARMAGLDFIINVVPGLRREALGIFAGDVVAAHRKGVELAKQVYCTEPSKDMDVVVVNAYSKTNEALIAMRPGVHSLREEGGDMVLVNHHPAGQVTHYLSGQFGNNVFGRLWGRPPLPSKVRRLILYTPYINKAETSLYGPDESVVWMKDWDEIIGLLGKTYGKKTRVAIYPDATLQYVLS